MSAKETSTILNMRLLILNIFLMPNLCRSHLIQAFHHDLSSLLWKETSVLVIASFPNEDSAMETMATLLKSSSTRHLKLRGILRTDKDINEQREQLRRAKGSEMLTTASDASIFHPSLLNHDTWILPHESFVKAADSIHRQLKLTSQVFTYDHGDTSSLNGTIRLREFFAVKNAPVQRDYGEWTSSRGLKISHAGNIWERRRSALRGVKIRVTHKDYPPFTIVTYDNRGRITGSRGYFPAILRQLQVGSFKLRARW